MFANLNARPDSNGCPFFDRQCTDCRITPSPALAANRYRRYCSGDRHEECPTLLVFLLRNSIAKSRSSSCEEFHAK